MQCDASNAKKEREKVVELMSKRKIAVQKMDVKNILLCICLDYKKGSLLT